VGLLNKKRGCNVFRAEASGFVVNEKATGSSSKLPGVSGMKRTLWKHSIREWLGLNSVPPGYLAIEKTFPDDVFIVGYPKSGSTWFQHLVAAVVYGVDPRWSPPLLANDLVPDIHFNRFYRRYSTPMFFKSHDLPAPNHRRVVYLLRDGRDVMVSYHHFLEAVHRSKVDFHELIRTGLSLIPCKWHEHVEAWHSNAFGAEMLVVRYEDLIAQPVTELERFCQFIHLPRKRPFLETVAEACCFQNLRAKEAKFGMGQPDRWPADKFFFRRGKVGSYKDEMATDVLALFMQDAKPTLRRHGYLTAEEDASSASESTAVLEAGNSPQTRQGFTRTAI
jgi:hypothetical protein